MNEQELVSIIEREVATSIGGSGGGGGTGDSATTTTRTASQDLASERAMELDYYNSKPLGNERDGESQVVSSDVFDTVEGMLPHLIKTFTASDDAVVFEPQGQEDEEQAKQRTEVCNYVFYRQNNGFLVMYEWFKDALLQKNGVVKYWWQEKSEVSDEEWQGLTEGEYLTLEKDDEVEILEKSSYDDPTALEQKEQMVAKLQQTQDPRAQMALAQIESMPVPQLWDCKAKVTKDKSQICIHAIAPEDFGISSKHNCITIQDASFVYHKTKMTISELKSQGCPDDILDEIASSERDDTPEVMARNRFMDEGGQGNEPDPSMREVIVYDGFIRVDYDGDGVAELRHFIMPGRKIWKNEPASHINFAAITPIIMPHRWVGKSAAEMVMDIQYTNSVLMRQMLNNLYLTNNPQKVVLGSQGGIIQADLDRLMTSRVGGILVEYQPNAIRGLEVPFVAGQSFPMLEYLQSVKENRTGITRYNQGTDSDSLNKTARGIQMIQNASQQKLDLIARIFAETGVKDLFRGIAYYLSKYSSKKMTLRLRNNWVDVDPREWTNQFDMTINVGLGTGNKDAQLVHLVKMNELQLELMKTGRGYMVTDQNVYNLVTKMSENMGFKHPGQFITDPTQVQKPPPQPNPEILKLQQADKEATMKVQSAEKVKGADLQVTKEIEEIKARAQIVISQMEIASKEKIAQMEIQANAQIELFKAQHSLQGEAAELDKKKLGVAYEEHLLEIKKNIDEIASQEIGQRQDRIVSELTAPMEQAITSIATEVGNLANGLSQTAAQTDQLANKLGNLEKKAGEKKPPRSFKARKTSEGFEITPVL